ncbi:hypothetical protein NKH18_15590 [Streptomyces sp. M10(2022)]
MHTLTESPALVENGFARWDLAEEFGITESDASFQSLRAEFVDLPPDPYATEAGATAATPAGSSSPGRGSSAGFRTRTSVNRAG